MSAAPQYPSTRTSSVTTTLDAANAATPKRRLTPDRTAAVTTTAFAQESVEVGPVWFRVPGYRFAQPVRLTIERTEDVVLVYDDRVHRHGEGLTVDEALADYSTVLIQYFEFLQSRSDSLAPRLQGHLRYLETLISREQ